MKKGKLIDRGMTAEVYEWGQDKVIKLFYDHFSNEWINTEAEIGKTVYTAGVPAPEVFDIIDVDGRKGIIFERIYGKSILKHLELEPWLINYYGTQLAKMQYKIHQYTAEKLPSQKEKLHAAIKRSENILGDKQKVIFDYIDSLPAKENVCHGDVHFNNIIISGKTMTAIDWSNAYRGNPAADVARTCLMINLPTLCIGPPSILSLPYLLAKSLLHQLYLDEYTTLAQIQAEDIDAWILPVAAAKLKEKIPGEEKWLLDIINKRLEALK